MGAPEEQMIHSFAQGVAYLLAAATTAACAGAGADLPTVPLAVILLLRRLGLSSLMIAAYTAAYATLQQPAIARATTALNVVSRVGASAGVAVLITVLELSGGAVDASAFTVALLGCTVVTLGGLSAATRLPREALVAPRQAVSGSGRESPEPVSIRP